MRKVTIGRTGLVVEKTGFGALPIQRVDREEAAKILQRAYDGGITYFDTARAYSDSEEKIGYALSDVRQNIVLATKTMATNPKDFQDQLETSLRTLKTDYIDIYQFHNPAKCYKPGDGTGMYEAALEAKQQGKIRFISITNHRMDVANEAIDSGLYETLQYPFSYLSTDKELALVKKCQDAGMGFIAMKGLAGGLINHSETAAAWMEQFPDVIPIWGIQRMNELEEFLAHMQNPPQMTEEIRGEIERDREQLKDGFCRGCGYCMPCPMGIQINNAARMSLMLRRAPVQNSLNDNAKAVMKKIEDCMECGLCASKCPYGLNTPELLKRNYKDYQEVLAGKPLLPHNY